MFNANGKKFLSTIQKSTNTYIWWNWSSTFLRIFGSDNACNAAYRGIDEYIQEQLQNQKHTINVPIPQGEYRSFHLNTNQFVDTFSGSLRQCLRNTNTLKEMNDEKSVIEIDLKKKVIRISGEEMSVKSCENRVRQYLATLTDATSSKTTTNTSDCPLCCDTCDTPYALQQCGHVYCRGCLTNFFETKIDPTLSLKEFRLTCPVDKCESACLIRDIKSILGAEKTLRLARIALQIYLRQPGVDLAQCVGIDCSQVSFIEKIHVVLHCICLQGLSSVKEPSTVYM